MGTKVKLRREKSLLTPWRLGLGKHSAFWRPAPGPAVSIFNGGVFSNVFSKAKTKKPSNYRNYRNYLCFFLKTLPVGGSGVEGLSRRFECPRCEEADPLRCELPAFGVGHLKKCTSKNAKKMVYIYYINVFPDLVKFLQFWDYYFSVKESKMIWGRSDFLWTISKGNPNSAKADQFLG